MRALYTVSIRVFVWALHVASLWNEKARKAVRMRKQQREAAAFPGDGFDVWFHCASLGEFEQARPVIEAMHRDNPQRSILVSFFSPSGYDVRHNYNLATVVYLPFDLPGRMESFLDFYQPKRAFFVKYEVWPNCFRALEKRGIPVVMFSAIFRPGHRYFQWYGGLFRKALHSCKHLFVQNAVSVELLHSIGIEQVSLAGDTRFDRVSDVAANANRIPMVESFLGEDWTWIAGSSWSKDEEWLAQRWNEASASWKLVIAPHEVDEAHIQAIEDLFPQSIRYSKLSLGHEGNERVLIIDNIGMLTQLYQYGHVALIGGGFGRGIHNVLEAAVFGMPVIFGPQHTKFDEALGLLQAGGAVALKNVQDVPEAVTQWITDHQAREEAGRRAREFVRSGTGATTQIRATLAEE